MRSWFVLTIVAEVLAKLSLFGAVLVFFVGGSGALAAAKVAAFATVLGVARAFLRAELVQRLLDRLYGALGRTMAHKSLVALASNREEDRPSDLVNAAFDVATVQAQALPDLVGALLSLGIVLVAMTVRLGWLVPALGLGAASLVVFALTPARIFARRARERGWDAHVEASKLLDVLKAGALELRGSGRQTAIERAFHRQTTALAAAERGGMRLGSAIAAVPAVLTLAFVALPSEWLASFSGERLGEIGVFAAAGVSLTFAAIGGLDALVRNTPVRRSLESFLGVPPAWLLLPPPVSTPAEPSSPASSGAALSELAFVSLSVRYPGALRETPHALTCSLSQGQGVALIGPNGAGKSTALLAALGLITPSSGAIQIDGRPIDEAAWLRLREHAIVIPQRPFVVPEETVGWHLATFGTGVVDPAAALAALQRVGVGERLQARAAKRGCELLSLPMGELSGGERQRVALARVVLSAARLVLLDEPEAGLDAEGRELLRELVAELARERLVLLVAHDEAIVPAAFRRVSVGA